MGRAEEGGLSVDGCCRVATQPVPGPLETPVLLGGEGGVGGAGGWGLSNGCGNDCYDCVPLATPFILGGEEREGGVGCCNMITWPGPGPLATPLLLGREGGVKGARGGWVSLSGCGKGGPGMNSADRGESNLGTGRGCKVGWAGSMELRGLAVSEPTAMLDLCSVLTTAWSRRPKESTLTAFWRRISSGSQNVL